MRPFQEMSEKLINRIMISGKKFKAERIFQSSCQLIEKRIKGDSQKLIEKAILKVAPVLEVRSLRVAGSTYQIPFPIPERRQPLIGISLIVKSARSRSEIGMARRLAGELMDAARGRGASIRKRKELHKLAIANRAFAHYRWATATS